MKLSRLALLALFAHFSVAKLAAQEQQHIHADGYPCSMSHEDGLLVKARMLENRRLVEAGLLNPNRRSITYIPVAIHNVGNTSGQGFVSVENILAMLCDVNNDYADQDVRFYIKDSIRYLQNNNIYNDAMSFGAALAMNNNKVGGTLNIYMSPTVNNRVASYYTPIGDYVFLIDSEVNGSSNTATHEIGHFFTLNHTFYGWEGRDVEAEFPNAAPTTISGTPVEFASGSNCQTAADGFCDTPADYYSDRVPCPYSGSAKDPNGVPIQPDFSNYMSYAFNSCVTNFTVEQKAAMRADLQSRGWNSLPAPPRAGATSPNAVMAYSPSVLLGIETPVDIRLTWSADAQADAYLVFLERTLLGTPVESVFTTVIYGDTSLLFNSSIFTVPSGNAEYSWRVRPFNNHNTCGGYSQYFNFRTRGDIPASTNEALRERMDLRVVPNPVSGTTARFLINMPEVQEGASLELYALDGRLISRQKGLALQLGDTALDMDISQLSAGIYLVVLHTASGTIQQKLIKQ